MSATGLAAWFGATSTQLTVKPTVPPSAFLKFPPSSIPATLASPTDHPIVEFPFHIPQNIYNALLSANVPITVALVYATIVTLLNRVNAERKYKPWAFSRTRVFRVLVMLHNAFLAVYSLWTFIGMVTTLRHSLVSPRSEYGVVGFVDSLCKMHGPRGLGSAATYNATSSAWGFTNRLFHLAADGLTPETSDVGRMWNEGLAFYGWIFYVSKFYEVVDTMIILLKGKKSSLLQTYHHAGAMMCMWAGIRYMSPPIWMFVLVNSGVHFVMYSFYLCGTLGIQIPTWFKRTLTTLQITQFVVGASYAFLHLFVGYKIPISVPYLYHLGDVAAAVPSDASRVASTAMATASANLGAWLKKAAFRAAGREGLAENVRNDQGQTFGVDAVHAVRDLVRREETRYREEQQWVHCLDTSGQTFAILLNCVYLLPLTYLFARFFIRSYLQRVERRPSSTASEKAEFATKSGREAFVKVGRRLSQAFEDVQGGVDDFGDDAVLVDGDELKKEMAAASEKAKKVANRASERTVNIAEKTADVAKKTTSDVIEKAKPVAQEASKVGESVVEKAKEVVAQATPSEEMSKSAKKRAKKAQNKANEAANQALESMTPSKETQQKVKTEVGNAVQAGKEAASNAGQRVAKAAEDYLPENVDEAKKQVSDQASKVKETYNDLKEDAQASQATEKGKEEEKTVKKDVKTNGDKTDSEPTKQAEMEKKTEDKIIDESQIIRDEDVDTKPKPKPKKEGGSPVKKNKDAEGAS